MSEIPLWREKTHDQNLSKDCGQLYGKDVNLSRISRSQASVITDKHRPRDRHNNNKGDNQFVVVRYGQDKRDLIVWAFSLFIVLVWLAILSHVQVVFNTRHSCYNVALTLLTTNCSCPRVLSLYNITDYRESASAHNNINNKIIAYSRKKSSCLRCTSWFADRQNGFDWWLLFLYERLSTEECFYIVDIWNRP